MKTEHFAYGVPENIRQKMLELSESVKEEFITDPYTVHSWHETLSESRLDIISGKAFDGFIPFQDGGFEVNCLYRFDTDSTYHFTQGQTNYINDLQESCIKDFCTDEKIEEEKLNTQENEKYWEYEQAYFQDVAALLRFEFWIDREETKKPYFVRVSLGYTDSPYFRSKHDETLFEFQVSESALLRIESAGFVARLKREMDKVK